MSDKQHIVVVCGYGCHLDTPLRPYLNRVFRFIQDQHPNAVVFCGGFTQQKSARGVSEAALMHEYVCPEGFPFMRVIVEDGSYTTHDNIKLSSRIIRECFCINDKNTARITIFCEATRAANVVMLARYFMGNLVESIDDIMIETTSWERADPFKQVKNLVYNKLAITFPWLGLAERECRKRIKRAEHI